VCSDKKSWVQSPTRKPRNPKTQLKLLGRKHEAVYRARRHLASISMSTGRARFHPVNASRSSRPPALSSHLFISAILLSSFSCVSESSPWSERLQEGGEPARLGLLFLLILPSSCSSGFRLAICAQFTVGIIPLGSEL